MVKRFEGRPQQSVFGRGIKLGILALLLAPLGLAARAGDTRVIHGDDLIPINPNFSFDPSLRLNGTGPELLSSGNAFGGQLANGLSAPPGLQQQLAASLTQAIGAANRPSVLTPYAGVLTDAAGNEDIEDTFGSIVTNKATTLGRGKIGIGLSYQFARFNSFDGHPIGRQASSSISGTSSFSQDILFFPDPDTPVVIGTLSSDNFKTTIKQTVKDVRFDVNAITLSLSYGLLDNVDIGALIPYIELHTSGKATIKVTQSATVTNSTSPGAQQYSSTRKFHGKWDRHFDGVGDVVLYSKWQILSQIGEAKRIKAPVDMALQAEVKLPTGNEDDFLGTGKTDVALRMLVQRRLVRWPNLALRGEVGFNRSGLGNDFNTLDVKAGADYQPFAKLNVSGEFISSYSQAFHEVLDFVAGAKYSVTSNMKVFAGLRVPITDNGLRYSVSPILGFEYTFGRRPASNSPTGEKAPAEASKGETAPAADAPAAASAPAPDKIIEVPVQKRATQAAPPLNPAGRPLPMPGLNSTGNE